MKAINNEQSLKQLGSRDPIKVNRSRDPSRPGDPGELKDATASDMIQSLLFRLSTDKLTIDDIRRGGRIFDAMEQESGRILLNDGDYDWLLKQAQEVGPRLFGMEAIRLLEKIEGALNVDSPVESE